jgi:VanZ family protein
LISRKKLGAAVAVFMLLFIGLATLLPTRAPIPRRVAAPCIGWCDDTRLADLVLNILLFVPLGFAARLTGIRSRTVILAGAAFSLSIELLQWRAIAGRDASLLDLFSNTLGTAVGVLLAAHLAMLLRPGCRAAARLALAGTLLWCAALFAGAWAVRPAPTSKPFWGQRAPQLSEPLPYGGEVVAAHVNGDDLPSNRLVHDDAIRESIRRGVLHLDVQVRPDRLTRLSSTIVRIADEDQREILRLSQRRGDVRFSMRLNVTRMRLRTPSVTLTSAFGSTPAVSSSAAAVSVDVRDGLVRLSSTREGHTRQVQLALSPALAWTFFVPWNYSLGPSGVVFTWLWLAAPLLPVGYWMMRLRGCRNAGWPIGLALVTLVVSLVAAPRLFALTPAPLSHWLAAAAGLAIGCVAALWRRPTLGET